MPAQLLKGKPMADKIKADVKKEVEDLKAKGVSPSLVAIQVGENDASRVYTNAQKKNAELCGIKYELQELPASMTQEQLIKHIDGLNADPNVTVSSCRCLSLSRSTARYVSGESLTKKTLRESPLTMWGWLPLVIPD